MLNIGLITVLPDGCNIVCSMRNGLYYAHQCFFCDPKKFYFLLDGSTIPQ